METDCQLGDGSLKFLIGKNEPDAWVCSPTRTSLHAAFRITRTCQCVIWSNIVFFAALMRRFGCAVGWQCIDRQPAAMEAAKEAARQATRQAAKETAKPAAEDLCKCVSTGA